MRSDLFGFVLPSGIDVQTFTQTGTAANRVWVPYSKPATCSLVCGLLIGAGGAGGLGRARASGVIGSGGGGGGGGGRNVVFWYGPDFPDVVYVHAPSAPLSGAGGLSAISLMPNTTTNNYIATGLGGSAGAAGAATNAAGGSGGVGGAAGLVPTIGMPQTGHSGAASTAGGAGTDSPPDTLRGSPSGASGGGCDVADMGYNGGAAVHGGVWPTLPGGVAPGGDGGGWLSQFFRDPAFFAMGGAGGAGHGSGVGGAGGGAVGFGAGGGGGGAGITGGARGQGGGGLVVLLAW